MVTRFLPFLEWFGTYGARSLQSDAAAGLSMAPVLIARSMAYAQLAGLPAYHGLYPHFHPDMDAAIRPVHRQTHRDGQKTNCALKTVVYRAV